MAPAASSAASAAMSPGGEPLRPAEPGKTWCVLELSVSAPAGKARKLRFGRGSIADAENFWPVYVDLVLADGTIGELTAPRMGSEGEPEGDVAGATLAASWLVSVPTGQASPALGHVLRIKADKGYAFLSTVPEPAPRGSS